MRSSRRVRPERHSPGTGLQAERTAMAWQRTALGVGAIGVLLLHTARGSGAAAWLVVPEAAAMITALALLVVAERCYDTTVHRIGDGDLGIARRAPGLLAGGVFVLSLVAAVSVVLVPTP